MPKQEAVGVRLMQWIVCLGLLPLLAFNGCGGVALKEPVAPRSRLTIVLVVDQMRADYLDRFEDQFDGGLARLLHDGRRFTNAHYQHNTTWTASGHTTLATGVHPSKHGIVGNQWWDRPSGKTMGAVTNDASPSAQLLRVTTINGPLRDASPGSAAWSIAIKDRAAIPMAGDGATGAFYFDPKQRRFTQAAAVGESAPQRPNWANSFDAGEPIEQYRHDWERSPQTRGARADKFSGERLPNEFPHRIPPGSDYHSKLKYTPFGDQFTLDFARALIVGERLGQDDREDLLWLSLSSADYIGHRYGPFSVEVEDYYLRLDRTLESWFEFLDSELGVDRWRLFLTSDHGIVPLPEQSRAEGFDAQRRTAKQMFEDAGAALQRAEAPDGAIELRYTNGWYLVPQQHSAVSDWSPERWAELRRRFAEELVLLPYINDTFTWDELSQPLDRSRRYAEWFANGFDAERSPDVQLVGRHLDLLHASPDGSNHGSGHGYDREIPLIAFGPGVEAGIDDGDVAAVDLAPTLARCFGLSLDMEMDGKPLNSVCDPAR